MSSTSTASDTDMPSMIEAQMKMKALTHLIADLIVAGFDLRGATPSMTEALMKRLADLMAAGADLRATPGMTEAHMKTLALLEQEQKELLRKREEWLQRKRAGNAALENCEAFKAERVNIDNIRSIWAKIMGKECGGVEAAVDTNDPESDDVDEGE